MHVQQKKSIGPWFLLYIYCEPFKAEKKLFPFNSKNYRNILNDYK